MTGLQYGSGWTLYLQDGCVYVDHMETVGDSTGATLHAAHNQEQIKSEPWRRISQASPTETIDDWIDTAAMRPLVNVSPVSSRRTFVIISI